MKHPITRIFTTIFAVAMLTTSAAAQTDTTFTYQGSLNNANSPANGNYLIRFLLYDASAGGSQIGSTFVVASQSVADGLFTTELDFGANAFDNSGRWLEIVIDGTTLSPRQPITRTPYSIQTRGINVDDSGFVGIGRSESVTSVEVFGIHRPGGGFGGMYSTTDAGGLPFYGYMAGDKSAFHYLDGSTGDLKLYLNGIRMTVTDDGKVGIGTDTPEYPLHVTAPSGSMIHGYATASSGTAVGMYGKSESTSGRGVFGQANSLTGTSYGVYGYNRSTSGRGVFGWATAITGTTYGVYGESQSTNGRGVYGQATALSGTTFGVYGTTLSQTGYGVYGHAFASSGISYGIFGKSDSISGRGMFGYATSSTGVNYGVIGRSDSTSGFDFYAGGAGINYGATSSRRWKNNIVNIDNPLDKLAQLRGVYFDWDEEHGGTHDIGMIAEEVGEVMPEIVNYEVNGDDAIGMDYSKITPLLVEATNALRAEKDAQLAEQDEQIEQLYQRITRLEQMILQITAELNGDSK